MNQMKKSVISLKNTKQFAHVYEAKNSYANKHLIMYVIKNNEQWNQIGISVSKKIGNSVVRHRAKRLILESYRLNQHMLLKGFDLVIVARSSIINLNYQEVESAFMHLIKIHRIFNVDFGSDIG